MKKFGLALTCSLVLLTAAISLADTAPTERKETEQKEKDYVPQNWLAFVAYSGGYTTPTHNVLNTVPYVMVFQDGRIVWRGDKIGFPGRDPEMWREGKVSAQALSAFLEKAKKNSFFTVQPPPPPAPEKGPREGVVMVKPIIMDAATTHLGVQIKDQRRVIAEYALEFQAQEEKNNPYLQALAEIKEAILSLRPKESHCYEPPAIRVQFLWVLEQVPADQKVVDWPLQDRPEVTTQGFINYTGDAMKAIIAALEQSTLVRIGDKVVNVEWIPALSFPRPTEKSSHKTKAQTK